MIVTMEMVQAAEKAYWNANAPKGVRDMRFALEAALAAAPDSAEPVDDEHLWRFWNNKAQEQAKEIDRLKSDREFIVGFNHGWEEAIEQNFRFPTMLRKMWSGSEVQAWIDEQFRIALEAKRLAGPEVTP